MSKLEEIGNRERRFKRDHARLLACNEQAREWAESWVNGNRSHVLDLLGAVRPDRSRAMYRLAVVLQHLDIDEAASLTEQIANRWLP